MNMLSGNITSIQSCSIQIGAPGLADPGAALSRLGGSSPAAFGGFDPFSFQMPNVMEMALGLMEMLTGLMVGQPNGGAGTTLGGSQQQQAAAVAKGGKIKGGPSNYAHGMFHKGDKGAPNSYAFENSPAGIKFAADKGYSSIDIDMQITKDGVPVATHWSQPMKKDGFFDPDHKLSPGTKINQMTLAEVMRLRNKDGQSRIFPVSTMIGELKKHNIAGDFEAKNDPRFASDQIMGQLANMVRQSGIKANLKSIDYGPGTDKILKKAQSYGFWVRTAEGNGKARRNIGYA
ncbi:hypothetical protein ABS71_07455 [bacterium SCN 62-11]|nr:MAG: hypothetical protein ABS71_07455 [bacterium SCN 62-11]